MGHTCVADVGETKRTIYRLCTPRRFSAVLATRRQTQFRACQSAIGAYLVVAETAPARALNRGVSFTVPAGAPA
jgi:hypothetical protein